MSDDWFPVAMSDALARTPGVETVLMGRKLRVFEKAGTVSVETADGTALPVRSRYQHVWTSLGAPAKDLFDIPEADQPERRLVPCGRIRVACSPLRAVENFLDIAHFPFVHTDILGAEPHTGVDRYDVRVREEVDEVWATGVQFFQPAASKSAGQGILTDYAYRVPSPTCSVLYKTCPPRPDQSDVIAIFVQPVAETVCDVWPWMALYDEVSTHAELVAFQQTIFLQDRSILENQIPALLPLDPGMELPTRADATSVGYRRWLRARGFTYGAQRVAA